MRLKTSHGLTLTEILVSMVIFAIVLLAMTGLMDVIQHNNTYNHQFTVASFLTQAKMEELQNFSFSDANLDPTTNWTPTTPETLTATGLAATDGRYRRQWKISADTPVAGLKSLEVRTAWTDGKKKDHEVSYSSAKAP